MRRLFAEEHEPVVYLPMYSGLNLDWLSATVKLRAGSEITIESQEGCLVWIGPGEKEFSLADCVDWHEEARAAFIAGSRPKQRFVLSDLYNEAYLEPCVDHWRLVYRTPEEPRYLRLELVEMEQLLNAIQLLTALSVGHGFSPREISPEEYAALPRLRHGMLQECQNEACCAHGRRVVGELVRP